MRVSYLIGKRISLKRISGTRGGLGTFFLAHLQKIPREQHSVETGLLGDEGKSSVPLQVHLNLGDEKRKKLSPLFPL
jgi:hypothetical protein